MARKEKKKAERGGKQGKGAPQTERDVAEQQLSGPKSFMSAAVTVRLPIFARSPAISAPN